MSDYLTPDQQRFATLYFYNQKNHVPIEVNKNETLRNEMAKHVSDYVMERVRELSELSKAIVAFDCEDIVRRTVNQALDLSGSSRNHIHWAPTQSGKTAFKVVKIIVYLTLNIPVVVVTKGKGESKELTLKMSTFLKNSRFDGRIFSVYEDRDAIEQAFRNTEKASALVIPDTHQKIDIANGLLSCAMKRAKRHNRRITGCALILDEVDAIIDRTEKKTQVNEQALEKLMTELEPSLLLVTATPIPVFMKYLHTKPIVTQSIETIPDYVGVKDMKLADDLDKASIDEGFLKKFSPKYIHKKAAARLKLFPTDKAQERKKFPNARNFIPKFNSQCIDLLNGEMKKKNVKGFLGLIDTCPWINTETRSCVFTQAAGTQDYFSCQNIELIAIVVHSTNIYYRLPGHQYGFKCHSHTTLGDLIDKIDSKFGLKMPVLVFGYHAMKRSRSFRSAQRVPTCMILCLGIGQSNESCRQAAGRLTFKGRSVLMQNRKTDTVSMLCPKEDFDMIQKHDLLVPEIIREYNEKGSTWTEIESHLSETSENFYLPDSVRRTGNYVPGQSKKRKRQSSGSKLVAKTTHSSQTKQTRSVKWPPMRARLQQLKKKSKTTFTVPTSKNRHVYDRQESDTSSSSDDSSSEDSSMQEDIDEQRKQNDSTLKSLVHSNNMRVSVESSPTATTDQVSTNEINVESSNVSKSNRDSEAKNVETSNDVDCKRTSEPPNENNQSLPKEIEVVGIVTDGIETSDDEGKQEASTTSCSNDESTAETLLCEDSTQSDDAEDGKSVSLGKRKVPPVANSTENHYGEVESKGSGDIKSTILSP